MNITSMIESDGAERKYTAKGKHSGFQIELFHKGLNEYKHLSARERDILEGKVHNQVIVWNKKWEKHLEKLEKEKEALKKQAKEEQATKKTEEARLNLTAIEEILEHTLDFDDRVNWDSLKNTESFEFTKMDIKLKPVKENYFKKISILKILIGQKKEIIAKQEIEYEKALSDWNSKKEEVRRVDLKRKEKFDKQKTHFNAKIDSFKNLYKEHDTESIEEYCEMVLNNSQYPETFPKDFELQYNENNKMLLIDYELPALNHIPNTTIVKYVKSKDDFDYKYLSSSAHEKLFDSAVYQIALRTLHEIFEADTANSVHAINLNGIVTDINPATGHKESNCIISIQAQKEEFEKINLESVDPKQCFKSLKGVGSTKLSSMSAIKPILELDKSDKRFTDHYNVAEGLGAESNLAAMDWEDFEHLVRELFEKEFAQNGGEVKVTQASSDGGVDAIAFDPDPIRGGKIVIQAKRYTNTVGVSAVRDLYGTVMSEGATKGILVTTADYGPDSYGFAKGKPLTLLNGSNLLHLLDKHGHKAKIDIKEAKMLLKDD